MSLYMDESKVAEKIINQRDLGRKPSESILLLAKYYYYIKNKKPKEIRELIVNFIKSTPICYRENDWEKCIDRNIKKAKKRPLIKINYIPITEKEMEVIQGLKSKPFQRLSFTLLCLAKYHNTILPNNNNWVDTELTKIFSLANIKSIPHGEKLYMLYDLRHVYNLIGYSEKITNTNMYVKYIYSDSKTILKVTDMRELGKQYLKFCGEKYICCERCGVVFKPTRNNSKYCKDCRGYQPIGIKTIVCCDCGKEFELDARNMKKIKCDNCQHIYRNQYQKELMSKKRSC